MNFGKRVALRIANSLWLIALVYVVSIVVGAALFSMFEHQKMFDSIWWAQTTSLTIGYGDLFPKTTPGKVSAMVIDHLWVMVLTPMVAANIFVKMLRNMDGWTHREQEWLMGAVETIAARLELELPPQPRATNDGEVVETANGDQFVDMTDK